jgi:hypothetical protein
LTEATAAALELDFDPPVIHSQKLQPPACARMSVCTDVNVTPKRAAVTVPRTIAVRREDFMGVRVERNYFTIMVRERHSKHPPPVRPLLEHVSVDEKTGYEPPSHIGDAASNSHFIAPSQESV